MINLSLLLIVLIVLILWVDWKVLRTLPTSNRWVVSSLFVLSIGIFIFNLKFDKAISPTAWLGRIIKQWMPF